MYLQQCNALHEQIASHALQPAKQHSAVLASADCNLVCEKALAASSWWAMIACTQVLVIFVKCL
jgi:hypothetical protein